MSLEIERKFLVAGWLVDGQPRGSSLGLFPSREIVQGYLSRPGGPAAVRVRIEGEAAEITVKSALPSSVSGPALVRPEEPVPLPLDQAKRILSLTPAIIRKTRYDVEGWVIDVFHDELTGLVLAERELSTPTERLPDMPAGLIRVEVTADRRFANEWLAWMTPGERNNLLNEVGRTLRAAQSRVGSSG